MKRFAILALLAISLSACNEEEAKAPPQPTELTEEALSYFCQMNVAEHGGPKGQIHLDGHPAPLFFAQVRDLVAYLKSPEREADITAIYVSNMAVAQSWADPGTDNWIAASDAVYVVGAGVAGGMGAPEIVPFDTVENAQIFIAAYGGQTFTIDTIPDDAAIGPVNLNQPLETPS